MNSFKNDILFSIVVTSSILFGSCSNDEEPVPVNEEEVITTMTITFVPQGGGGSPVILQTRDLDGDGPNAPVVSVSGSLSSGQTYDANIALLNETESPAEDITSEVQAEGDEHQFFYLTAGNLELDTDYDDVDGNGNPIGLSFIASAGNAGTGTLTVVLRHLPDKEADGVSEGDITNAGGNTDVSEDFPLEIQ